MMTIRTLNADEIECRVSTVKKTKYGVGCSLLLYKDARCDMRIMDETFGQMNWARQHELIGDRLYCIVSVYDAERGQWVSKQDVGTESNTEKEKGQASDSFKRACTNWGIGRELYTAPFIWVNLRDGEYYEKNSKYGVNIRFCVSEIGYNEKREINKLTILDENGNQRYCFLESEKDPELVGEVEIETLKKVANALGAKTKNEFRAATGIPYSEIEKLTKSEWGALMVELNQKMDDAAQQRAMQDDA